MFPKRHGTLHFKEFGKKLSKHTVSFRAVDAEEVVVAPENAVAVFYLCFARHRPSIHTRSTQVNPMPHHNKTQIHLYS